MTSPVRWIGFDMDECVGSVMPLFHFVETIEIADMRQAADQLITSEEAGHTWLIRPAMKQVLALLGRAYLGRQIQGAFILSNNSSELLVNFLAMLFNRWIQRIFQRSEEPLLFVMGISASTPVRLALGADMRYIKDFRTVQHCLAAHRFPVCSSPDDLLFFDDQSHVLEGEIPHYCRVRAYHNQTPIWRIREALGRYATDDAVADATELVQERDAAHRMARLQAASLPFAPVDPRRLAVEAPFPATLEETNQDTRVMIHACLKFLAPRGGRRSYSLRSSRKKRRKRRLTE